MKGSVGAVTASARLAVRLRANEVSSASGGAMAAYEKRLVNTYKQSRDATYEDSRFHLQDRLIVPFALGAVDLIEMHELFPHGYGIGLHHNAILCA
jgi:hypothetical protein